MLAGEADGGIDGWLDGSRDAGDDGADDPGIPWLAVADDAVAAPDGDVASPGRAIDGVADPATAMP